MSAPNASSAQWGRAAAQSMPTRAIMNASSLRQVPLGAFGTEGGIGGAGGSGGISGSAGRPVMIGVGIGTTGVGVGIGVGVATGVHMGAPGMGGTDQVCQP